MMDTMTEVFNAKDAVDFTERKKRYLEEYSL